MSTYLVDCGHTLQGADTGATGNGFKEQNCTREIGKHLKNFLEEENNNVFFVHNDNATSVNNSLAYRVNEANKYTNAVLFISLHMNSASNSAANGTEVYISATGGQAEVYAKRVVNKIASIGYINRGVKTANFYVLKNTIAPAILVECCFISSAKDMSLYDPKKIAKAIAEGILNKNINSSNSNNESEVEEMPNCYLQTKVLNTTGADGLLLDNYINKFKEIGAKMYVKNVGDGVILESSTLSYQKATELKKLLGDDFLHFCFR